MGFFVAIRAQNYDILSGVQPATIFSVALTGGFIPPTTLTPTIIYVTFVSLVINRGAQRSAMSLTQCSVVRHTVYSISIGYWSLAPINLAYTSDNHTNSIAQGTALVYPPIPLL